MMMLVVVLFMMMGWNDSDSELERAREQAGAGSCGGTRVTADCSDLPALIAAVLARQSEWRQWASPSAAAASSWKVSSAGRAGHCAH